MKRIVSLATAAVIAAAFTTSALANGQGTPIEPARPMPPAPTVLQPAGPAPAATVTKTASSQNWWLIALAAAVAIGIIIAVDEDDDTNN